MQWGHEGVREPDLEPDSVREPEEEIFDIYNICQK